MTNNNGHGHGIFAQHCRDAIASMSDGLPMDGDWWYFRNDRESNELVARPGCDEMAEYFDKVARQASLRYLQSECNEYWHWLRTGYFRPMWLRRLMGLEE